MRRVLLIFAGIAVLTWFQFEFFPGHTYLQSDTQVYVPILEKLDSPGLLSRDLVATHPNLTYTIYDEITLFLHAAFRLSIENALLAQQIVFRGAGLLGIFLLVESAGLSARLSLLVAAIINSGAFLSGPDIPLIDPEPTPRAFALGLIILAIGLFAKEKPLQAGLTGGLAFVYDPRVAAPVWLVIFGIAIFDRSLRRLIRPSLTIFAIFVLLLANLAQLQPGAPDSRSLFETLAAPIARIERYRTSYVWVSSWAASQFPKYLLLALIGFLAARRVWPALNRQTRWFFAALPLIGILSVPASYLLLERLRWYPIPQIKPAQALSFTVLFASVACAIAGLRAAKARRWAEALPLIAVFILIPFTALHHRDRNDPDATLPLAQWAAQNTWGGSMFLFPDAGRERYPGLFRALSRRAVWVDWETGKQMDFFDTFADEWSRRWRDSMEGVYSEARLQRLLSLPIDYYVLTRIHAWNGATPVFATDKFVVYEAQTLKNLSPAPAPAVTRGD